MAEKLGMKPALSLDVAKAIASAAEDAARRNGWSVTIVIVDDGGGLLYLQRMDNIANASVDVAIAKARHSVNFRRPTKFHEDLVDGGNYVVLGIPGMIPLEGGLPLLVDGFVIGAIGVSGVQSYQDGEIAQAGVAALEAYCVS